MTFSQYFSGLFKGIKSLVSGMAVTIRVFFDKKVTQQYPENRDTLVIPPRVRGNLMMPHDSNNEHACTACGICQTNCPNGTIQVISEMIVTEEGKKKKILKDYYYNLGQCTFCNLCVLTCPSDAIEFSNEFENSVFTRPKLMEKLNHDGSKLKEKKPAPKPAPVKPEVPIDANKESKPVEGTSEPATEVKPSESLASKDETQEVVSTQQEVKTEEKE